MCELVRSTFFKIRILLRTETGQFLISQDVRSESGGQQVRGLTFFASRSFPASRSCLSFASRHNKHTQPTLLLAPGLLSPKGQSAKMKAKATKKEVHDFLRRDGSKSGLPYFPYFKA